MTAPIRTIRPRAHQAIQKPVGSVDCVNSYSFLREKAVMEPLAKEAERDFRPKKVSGQEKTQAIERANFVRSGVSWPSTIEDIGDSPNEGS